MVRNTVKAIKNVMDDLNKTRKSRNTRTSSNQGYIGLPRPGTNEQHVNHGRFTLLNSNNRVIMKFVPNNPNNRTNIQFRRHGNGIQYKWKWPNMVNWSPWNSLQAHNSTMYPNMRPIPPPVPMR